MMKLFTVCMAVFFMLAIFGCTDDTAELTQVEQLDATDSGLADAESAESDVDDVSSDDSVATEEDVATGEDDATSTGDVEVDDTSSLDDTEQMASDPTEDPANHSAFYEFPEWEIPSSDDDDNR